jgi:protein O-mannosyl-transferase
MPKKPDLLMISFQPLIKKYAILLITVIGIIAYINSFNNTFQFDDGYHIVDGAKIKNIHNVLTSSHWKAIGDRPLAFFTLAVNYKLNELDVTGYHIVNLLFHVLAGFIAFLLTLEILSLPVFRKNKTVKDYKVLIAIFTAFIFVAHPIQTQAVTYIIQRMTVMAGLFYMWAVLLYIRGRNAHLKKPPVKAWKPFAYYAGAFFAGFLAIISKQNAVTFPLAFILVEFLFIRKEDQKIDRKFFIALSSVIGFFILIGLIFYGLPREFDKISRSEYLFTQFRVMVKYWQLLFLPVNQHLDYYWQISISLWGLKELLSLLFLLVTIGLGIWSYRKNWLIVSFCIFWFYLTLSVESTIIPIRDVIFEHRLYMAVFGFGFAISYFVFYLFGSKNGKYAIIFLSLLTMVYAAASINRNRAWKNPYTLWTDSTEKDPKRERAWYWLASNYMIEKDNVNAMKCYDTSIKCNSSFTLAYNGRANLKKDNGDLKGAIADYNKAISLDPKYVSAYYNRGIAYAASDKLQEAIKDYDQSIKLGNNSSSVYYNRGNAKRRAKDGQGAIEDYNQAIKLSPDYPLAFYNRGLTKDQLKNHEEAIKDIDIAIKIDPKNHLFYNGKGVALLALNKYKEAIENFNTSIQLKPDFGQAYFNRGYAKHKGLNDTPGACQDWKTALEKGYKKAEMYLMQYCR